MAQGYAIACQLCARLLIALTTATARANETKDSATKELARSFIYHINNNVRGVQIGLLIFCFGACPWHNNRWNWVWITAGQEGRQWQMKVKRGRQEKEGTRRGAPCHSSLFLNTLRTTSHGDQNSGHLRHVWVTPSEFRSQTRKSSRNSEEEKEQRRRVDETKDERWNEQSSTGWWEEHDEGDTTARKGKRIRAS